MAREDRQREEHLLRHPLGRVPVIEEEGGFVFESAAIRLHLAELHPEAGLIPAPQSHERALVYQWTFFAMDELEPRLATTIDADTQPSATNLRSAEPTCLSPTSRPLF
jgi:glutathione S-transferase